MAHFEKDEVPMPSETRAQLSDERVHSNFRRLRSRTRSGSISIPMVALEEQYEKETSLVGHTSLDCKFFQALYGNNQGFGRRVFSLCCSCVPGVMNPYARIVQQWNKFLAISCMLAIFVDPLFFFLIYVKKDDKCIAINWSMTNVLVTVRSMNDFVFFLNILLQFRLAYASDSRFLGTGTLDDHPMRIALKYLMGYFLIDLFVVVPLPEIMILFVLRNYLELSGANFANNLLRVAILVQYFPRYFRFLNLLLGQSPPGFIFRSARATFSINLLILMLCGHVVGSCWYLFGLQRVNQCLRNACHTANITRSCTAFIDCGHGLASAPDLWKNNTAVIACLDPSPGGFAYGIFQNAVPLTIETNVVDKYVFALFWGFQQISTLAGNQTPSYFVWEVLFTLAVIGLGLLIFALIIGNIQNFLHAIVQRGLEMLLIRDLDVEKWMSLCQFPDHLRRRIREAERYNWVATRGVDQEMLLENLPEDLQTDIRRHLFKFVRKIRILALMDQLILDAICERLKQKRYIKGSRVLSHGGLVDKIVFVVRGKLESIGEDGNCVTLSEGDACGEELLTWYLEHSFVTTDGKKIRLHGQRLQSSRTVRCLTNVEAYWLRAADLEEVTILFARFFRSPQVQAALRYESPYWRSLAATRIQVEWRYRKKRQNRAGNSQPDQTLN